MTVAGTAGRRGRGARRAGPRRARCCGARSGRTGRGSRPATWARCPPRRCSWRCTTPAACRPRTRPTARAGCARARAPTARTAPTRPPRAATWARPRPPGRPCTCARPPRARRRSPAPARSSTPRAGTAAVVRAFERGDPAVVYLALAGLRRPGELPCPPMLPALIRPAVRFMERRFHSGILMVSGELGADRAPAARRLGRRRRAARPDRAALRARTLALLATFQNRDGSWNANTVQTALALPALRAAGLGRRPSDGGADGRAGSRRQRVRDDEGLHFDVFGSPVWCTAANLRALMAAGERPGDPRAVRRARLADRPRSRDSTQPEVDNRNPGAPRIGGWAFQPGNETMVDNDDTGAVLAAFGDALARRRRARRRDRRRGCTDSRDLGRDWLLGMQNPDGGWSAFVHGLPAKRPGPHVHRHPGGLDGRPGGRRPHAARPAARAGRPVDGGPDRARAGRARADRPDGRRGPGAPRDRVPARAAVRQRRLLGPLDRQLPGGDLVRADGARARGRRHDRALGPAGGAVRRRRARTPTAAGASCRIPTATRRWRAGARACRRSAGSC